MIATKGVFLHYKSIKENDNPGVDKKILAQLKSFNAAGLNCTLRYLESGLEECSHFKKLANKIMYRMPYSNILPVWSYKSFFDNIDYLYFRRPNCFTVHTLKTLNDIKNNNPAIKIILEIPTYPYDQELLRELKHLHLYVRDRVNRFKLKGLVDRIVTLSDDPFIFGLPTIKITNGIDLDLVSPKKAKSDDDVINICAVAKLMFWHGYERLITGLAEYYQSGGKRKIIFNIVGDGVERATYERLIDKYRLNNAIILHGVKTGSSLEQIYDAADLAVSSLAMHRKGLFFTADLKSREYLAKGLPVISGSDIDVIKEKNDFKYFYKVEANEKPIDINNLVDFYDNIYIEDKEEVIRKIREFAEETCAIEKTMQPVIDYILKR